MLNRCRLAAVTASGCAKSACAPAGERWSRLASAAVIVSPAGLSVCGNSSTGRQPVHSPPARIGISAASCDPMLPSVSA
jgi:hypothetical protein